MFEEPSLFARKIWLDQHKATCKLLFQAKFSVFTNTQMYWFHVLSSVDPKGVIFWPTLYTVK